MKTDWDEYADTILQHAFKDGGLLSMGISDAGLDCIKAAMLGAVEEIAYQMITVADVRRAYEDHIKEKSNGIFQTNN